ncbi:MAG: recombinase family protein [Verrucomicrobiota bacterium]
MKRAYNYVRFSSPPQEWGASERRQDDAAKAYCAKNGLTLVEKYIDKGVSAWKGKNKKNALGELVKVLTAGDYLLVEDEDRISRENPLTAGNFLLEIVKKGVSIVTVKDGKIITEKNFFEPNVFLPTILKAMLAHQEDNKKSDRLLDAWEERRQDIIKGKDRFGKLPFWLKRDKNTNALIRIPEAEKVVRDIFEMCNNGMGIRTIAANLIKTNTPTYRTSKGKPTNWNISTVKHVLSSPTVYGAYQSRRKINGKKINEGPLVENILPVIVPKDKVKVIQDKISRRKHFGTRGVICVNNIFSRITICHHCHSTMVYTTKGKHGYLTCSKFHETKSCKAGVINYAVIEKVILGTCIFALEQFAPFLPSQDPLVANDASVTLKAQLAEAKRKSQNIAKLLVEFPDSDDFKTQYREMQEQQKLITQSLEKIDLQGIKVESIGEEWAEFINNMLEGKLNRLKAREIFRDVIKTIDVEFKEGRFTINWVSERKPDTFEIKQTFRGCKPAIWHWRAKWGCISDEWTEWRNVAMFNTLAQNKIGTKSVSLGY